MKRKTWISLAVAALAVTLLAVPSGLYAADQGGVATDAPAPDFTLTDTNGNTHSLSDFAGKTVILEWINKDCPFVKKFYKEGHMQGWQADFTANPDVVWLSICSSAPGNQGHMSPGEWNQHIDDKSINSTAVLIDEDGTVGQLYAAKTTPHIYVIDGAGVLRYQGAIDSKKSTKTSDIANATNYLAAAMTAVLAGEEVQDKATTPYGCSVKY